MTLASSAGETLNNSGNSTINITNPDPLWKTAFTGSSWVSYTNSGNPAGTGFVSPPNGTSVIFSDTFTVSGTPTAGLLYVMADDSASVTLNGTLLMPLAPSAGNTYKVCSDFPIGCLPGTIGTIYLDPGLVSGVNTLDFDVVQSAGVAYGLDYLGMIDYTPNTAAPEPATLALIGLPLALFGLIRLRGNSLKH
jgi:hypothetical protein